MTTETRPVLAIGKVFTAAVLLCADVAQAEDAVADAILSLETDNFGTEAFWTCVLFLSLQRSRNVSKRSTRKVYDMPYALPVELQRVLNLPWKLRHSFVLRTLLALPRDVCSQMLQMGDDEVENSVRAAALQLAAMREYN
jgi:hypothetical protein